MSQVDSALQAFAATQEQAPSSLSEGNRGRDWAIVQRVQTGDMGAFDQLVKKYREPIFSIIYNLTNNFEDAADLTQETFIKAFQAIARFKGKSSFFTWIHRIAVNATITFLKKQSRCRYISYETINKEASNPHTFEQFTAENHIDKSVLIHELQEKLNDSLQKLSLKHRTVVVLHEIQGLSHPEIAEITKVSICTVRSRLHYAKQQLQAYLKDYLS